MSKRVAEFGKLSTYDLNLGMFKLRYVSSSTFLNLGLTGCASRLITIRSNTTSAESFGLSFGQLKAMQLVVIITSASDILQGQVLVQNKKSAMQNFQYQVQCVAVLE